MGLKHIATKPHSHADDSQYEVHDRVAGHRNTVSGAGISRFWKTASASNVGTDTSGRFTRPPTSPAPGP